MPRVEVDPQLPYIQVHRSVSAMASQIAPLLGVTYQHARGAFDVFWESLADRRILARALLLPEPMVVLDDLECRQRLQLAFGAKVEPAMVATVGALELLPDKKWRVRGMSRYLETERGRRDWADKSAKGGRSRAAGARDAGGRLLSQPPPAIEPASDHARDERREVRGKSEELKDEIVSSASVFWGWAQDLRQKAGCVREAPPETRNLSGWYSAAMMELNGDDDRLREAFLRFGDDEHWQHATPACPFRAFMNAETGWRKYAPRKVS